MLYKDPVDHPTIEEITVYPLNRAELRMADAYVNDRSSVERSALEQAVRGRGTAYVARFRHTTEMSCRMPVLYSEALADGRMTIDHIDTVWRRLDRHPGVRTEIDDQIVRREERKAEREKRIAAIQDAESAGEPVPDWSGEEDYDDRWSGRPYNSYDDPSYPLPEPENGRCSHIDQSVEREIIDWLRTTPQRLSSVDGSRTVTPSPSVTVHKLRDIVDRAADAAVEELGRLREQSLEWEIEADHRRKDAAVKAREDAEKRAKRRAERAAKKKAREAELEAEAEAAEAAGETGLPF
ncbi:SIMPL domain-containing protein [Corynebacterium variabile]|uniref:SIMPL domain-containing protein n=1 Tax=Corynebacterium variabile TaxID=1727 RepID=UPI0028ADAD4C|nr:SIMPL domain-containing protein [Corynebacterium variabile]